MVARPAGDECAQGHPQAERDDERGHALGSGAQADGDDAVDGAQQQAGQPGAGPQAQRSGRRGDPGARTRVGGTGDQLYSFSKRISSSSRESYFVSGTTFM
ncbi:hypothetical protein CHIBA101_0678 [Actinomyces sp. Chiba101]|nr:hypothetical protein CHIBA101_0678 [Actinomyces sp. Chiba101]GAV94502.1 hypothetical protein ADENT20671_1271 [Actinomyces denticolens]